MNPKKHWSHHEEALLLECLEAGCISSDIQVLLPNRTQKSILRKALYLGYSSSQKGNKIIFTYGIKHRNRRKTGSAVNMDIHSSNLRKNLFQIIAKTEYVNRLIVSLSCFVKRWGERHAS